MLTLLSLGCINRYTLFLYCSSKYIETNVSGNLNICQAAKDNNIRVIHTSTSEVYGTAQYVPIDEKHPHNLNHHIVLQK